MAVKAGTPAGTLVEARGQRYLLRHDAEAGNNRGMARGGLEVAYVDSRGEPHVTDIGRTAARVVAAPRSPEANAYAEELWAAIDVARTGSERAAAYWDSPTWNLPPRPSAARPAAAPASSATGNS